MSSNPFDYFKKLNVSYDRPTEEELTNFNSYLAIRYYANYYDTVLLAELASTITIGDEFVEMFLRGVIDKGKRSYFWPKADKDKEIQEIAGMFDTSIEKAKEIYQLIPNSKIQKLKAIQNATK